MAYPWVEDGVKQIGGEVAERTQKVMASEQPTSRGMSLLVAAKWIRPDTGVFEQGFHDHQTADQPADLRADDGDGRQRALRSTWRQMTVRGGRPLSVAVRV